MKIKSLTLRNFKHFTQERSFDFFNQETGEINDVTLIVGNNGTGKSSVLQAIAAIVGGASLYGFNPSDLNWPGYNYATLQSGRAALKAEAHVVFSKNEIEATREFAQTVKDAKEGVEMQIPDTRDEVNYLLDNETNKILASGGPAAFFQARGNQYAKQALALGSKKNVFEHVGSIYWYPEKRSSNSITTQNGSESTVDKNVSRETLRKLLSNWSNFNTSIHSGKISLRPGQRNVFAELEKSYSAIFPSRKIIGMVPKMKPEQMYDEPDFLFDDGDNQYDLDEMSGAERAIFPLLVDFAFWNINNSIILIDELELHLHPPLQQALLRALPKLGKNNQFIITTHSNAVASMVDVEQIIHLS